MGVLKKLLKAGLHIIVRSPKMIADSLGQSASVSRLNLQRSAMIRSRQSLGQEPPEVC